MRPHIHCPSSAILSAIYHPESQLLQAFSRHFGYFPLQWHKSDANAAHLMHIASNVLLMKSTFCRW